MRISIDDIRVGQRLRALRDVSELAQSIVELGLLQPIVVTEDISLVAGRHRLEACRQLGWETIPATVLSGDEVTAQLAEIDENLIREDLTELERAQHLKRRKELYEAAHPETRPVQKRGGPGRGKKTAANLSAVSTFSEDTAQKAGVSPRDVRRSVRRAEKIIEDVQELIADHPLADVGVELDALARLEPAEQLQAAKAVVEGEADSIRTAVRKKRRRERTQEILEQSEASEGLPTGKRYPVLLADPPWRYQHERSANREIENHYPTMTVEEICDLSVEELATDAAVLYLWVTSPKLEEGLRVLKAWGFSFRTSMVWVKLGGIGMGYWARQRHELILIGTRGDMLTPPEDARPDSVIMAPRGRHSEKPQQVYEIIERAYPELPKLELFARGGREGWDTWGHEAA